MANTQQITIKGFVALKVVDYAEQMYALTTVSAESEKSDNSCCFYVLLFSM